MHVEGCEQQHVSGSSEQQHIRQKSSLGQQTEERTGHGESLVRVRACDQQTEAGGKDGQRK